MPIEVLAVDEVTAATLRVAGFHATKGGTGVALPTDLRVRALPVPGAAVQVLRGPSGSAAIASNYPSAGGQSYLTVATETEEVAVPATGSSGGATRYVIQYVEDPQYAGQEPGARYALVGSPATFAHPNIVLARINQPASTATITQDMITDLRVVANPRSVEILRPRASVTDDVGLSLTATGADGEWFPNAGGEQIIDIPSWATRVQIEAKWLQVRYAANSNPYGRMWVEFGPYLRPSTRERSTQRFFFDAPSVSNAQRAVWIVADDVYVPAAYRGTSQAFIMKAVLSGGSGVTLDASSGVVLSVKFLEVADPSTS